MTSTEEGDDRVDEYQKRYGSGRLRQARPGPLLRRRQRQRAGARVAHGLPVEDRRAIGYDIKTTEFGWPIGMPICRALRGDLWEIRTSLAGNQIARVLFAVEDGELLLRHGFLKKTQRTPSEAIRLAEQRLGSYRR